MERASKKAYVPKRILEKYKEQKKQQQLVSVKPDLNLRNDSDMKMEIDSGNMMISSSVGNQLDQKSVPIVDSRVSDLFAIK